MNNALTYVLAPDSVLPCLICGDEGATLVVHREVTPLSTARAVCCECVSCLVTAGLQGAVHRDMDEDRQELRRDS